MAKRRDEVDSKGNYTGRETGVNDELLIQDEVQNTAGLAARAEAAKKATPQKEEEDPSKMSPLQRAAYLAKKRREGASTPTPAPTPLDDQEKKKRNPKNQLSALMGE